MLKQRKIRFLMIGMAIALLAAAMPLAALASEAASFSGDDAYDRAAGGTPESAFASSKVLMNAAAASFSGDDLYDPAAGGDPEAAFGNDEMVDAWNPSNPNLALLSAPAARVARTDGQQEAAASWNPGDPNLALFGAGALGTALADADPRGHMYAGWDPIDDAALASGVSSDEAAVDCNASGYSDSLAAVPGTYSGDDYYDPAAGGTPEQTVFAFAVAYGKLMACAPGDTVIQ